MTGGKEAENGGVNVALENTLVITRFIFFYPTGPDFVKVRLISLSLSLSSSCH